jgi:hypothetical protein
MSMHNQLVPQHLHEFLRRQRADHHAANLHSMTGSYSHGHGGGPDHDQGVDLYDDLYWYAANFGTMIANQQKQVQIIIQGDSKFEWVKTTTWGFKDATTPTLTDALPIALFLTDTGSGRQLMSESIPVNAICGDGRQPYINTVPRIFQPNAQIQASALNLTAVQYDFVFVIFHGRKVFRGR